MRLIIWGYHAWGRKFQTLFICSFWYNFEGKMVELAKYFVQFCERDIKFAIAARSLSADRLLISICLTNLYKTW